MNVPTWEELTQFNQGKPFFGGYVRELRIAKKMSLRSAAEQSGVSASFWSDMEHGRIHVPKETLAKVAEVLGTTSVTLRLHQERLDHELKLWLDKHPKVVQWLRALAEKER